MAKGYMFYDDETANSTQRICSLAYVLCDGEGNQIANPVSQLINPECEIAPINRSIHHISNNDVADMPTMQQFCDSTDFLKHLSEYVLVAHSAKAADLHHISKSLVAYELEMPDVEYVDTKVLATNLIGKGALKDVCDHFGIDFVNHHDALADAIACRAIFEKLSGGDMSAHAEVWGKEQSSKPSKRGRVRPKGSIGFVHGSEQTIEEVLAKLSKKGLRGNPDEITQIKGVWFSVTGGIPGYSKRDIAKDELEAKGAFVGGVSNKTQWIIIGDNAGQKKINVAEERGILVISSFDLLEILDRF